MAELYLKIPTLSDKEEWLEYIKEYKENDPLNNPLINDGASSYEEWLKERVNEHYGIDLKPGRVPATVYFLMKGNRIVGNLSIRHNINTEFLSTFGGHIGYQIRPSERRKGYGKKILNLALQECHDMNLKNVLITCKKENTGSRKIIESNMGEFKTEVTMDDGTIFKQYWIDVDKSLHINTPHR